MSAGSVYALTTPQGSPFYVGATVQSVGTRVGQHLRDARRNRRPGSQVHEVLAETGRCGVWVLESGIDPDRLGARERYHTFRLQRYGFQLLLYHHGGNGCCRQPAHIRQRIARFAAKRPRGPRGEFLPMPAPMAGGAPAEGELF